MTSRNDALIACLLLVACATEPRQFGSGEVAPDSGRTNADATAATGVGALTPASASSTTPPSASSTTPALASSTTPALVSSSSSPITGAMSSEVPMPPDGGTGTVEPDVGSGNTCDGCNIGSECVPAGQRNPQNPCEVCDVSASDSDWTADDAQACDDGQFCTENDGCQTGVCSGTPRTCDDTVACNGISQCDEATEQCIAGESPCGSGTICNLETDQCTSTCSGCTIAGQCVPVGGKDPNNACLTCQPGTSDASYAPAVGAACGATATECSAQDTCDAQAACNQNHRSSGTSCGDTTTNTCNAADTCDGNGQCLPNLLPLSTVCAGGHCQAGACATDPFDCVVPSPPAVVVPADYLTLTGTPPAASGGTIADGRYAAIRIDRYNGDATLQLLSFEFRSGFFVQAGSMPVPPWVGEVQFAGTFSTSGTTLTFAVQRCDPQYDTVLPSLQYTATANGLVTMQSLGNGITQVTTYARQ